MPHTFKKVKIQGLSVTSGKTNTRRKKSAQQKRNGSWNTDHIYKISKQ